MEKEYTIDDLRREKLMSEEDISLVTGAKMEAGIVESTCPLCGATIIVHLYGTDAVQRIHTKCDGEGCTYSYDYYFFNE